MSQTGTHSPQGTRPRVLIVGAGLGGLTLSLLLEKAGIPYTILERSAAIKPLGNIQKKKRMQVSSFAASFRYSVTTLLIKRVWFFWPPKINE
jgi:cation diffusion facilitator CzcD-associated flavoprotein CzcO